MPEKTRSESTLSHAMPQSSEDELSEVPIMGHMIGRSFLSGDAAREVGGTYQNTLPRMGSVPPQGRVGL